MTETEETGELTAYDQEAIQAAARCEESSYPMGGENKGKNKTQMSALHTAYRGAGNQNLVVRNHRETFGIPVSSR